MVDRRCRQCGGELRARSGVCPHCGFGYTAGAGYCPTSAIFIGILLAVIPGLLWVLATELGIVKKDPARVEKARQAKIEKQRHEEAFDFGITRFDCHQDILPLSKEGKVREALEKVEFFRKHDCMDYKDLRSIAADLEQKALSAWSPPAPPQ